MRAIAIRGLDKFNETNLFGATHLLCKFLLFFYHVSIYASLSLQARLQRLNLISKSVIDYLTFYPDITKKRNVFYSRFLCSIHVD